MEQNESARPLNVGLLRTDALMPYPDRFPNSFEERAIVPLLHRGIQIDVYLHSLLAEA